MGRSSPTKFTNISNYQVHPDLEIKPQTDEREIGTTLVRRALCLYKAGVAGAGEVAHFLFERWAQLTQMARLITEVVFKSPLAHHLVSGSIVRSGQRSRALP